MLIQYLVLMIGKLVFNRKYENPQILTTEEVNNGIMVIRKDIMTEKGT